MPCDLSIRFGAAGMLADVQPPRQAHRDCRGDTRRPRWHRLVRNPGQAGSGTDGQDRAGTHEALNIHKRDRVKAGQVFLVLWNEDLVARGQRSQHQLLTATAHVHEVCELAKLAAALLRLPE